MRNKAIKAIKYADLHKLRYKRFDADSEPILAIAVVRHICISVKKIIRELEIETLPNQKIQFGNTSNSVNEAAIDKIAFCEQCESPRIYLLNSHIPFVELIQVIYKVTWICEST